MNITPSISMNKGNFVKLKFNYYKGNNFGIGTKVISYHSGVKQYKQLFTSKGFQSSSEAMIHFGYGQDSILMALQKSLT